jgi:Uma2 family endonuclease
VDTTAGISIEELAATTSAETHGRLYETALERVLAVDTPPDATAACLTAWLMAAGVPSGQVMPRVGVRVTGPDGHHDRVPDLTVWSRPQPHIEWLTVADLLLVIEIGSDGTEATHYATAGIVHYWTVTHGAEPAITMHQLDPGGAYVVTAQMPLDWLPQMVPAWVLTRS